MAEAGVEKNMLETSLIIELSDIFVESIRVRLREVKRTMGNGNNAFVCWSLQNGVNGAGCSKVGLVCFIVKLVGEVRERVFGEV